jgi:hypothetical protein
MYAVCTCLTCVRIDASELLYHYSCVPVFRIVRRAICCDAIALRTIMYTYHYTRSTWLFLL